MSERTLEQALAHAEKTRIEIPQLVQPEPSAYDLVLLADEVLRLRAEVKHLEYYEMIHKEKE